MNYPTSIINIISEIFNSISDEIIIESYTNNEDGTHSVIVKDIKWISDGNIITIGEKEYTVSNISGCSFTLTGDDSDITATSFDLPEKIFFHGTMQGANIELDQRQFDGQKKYILYLLEIFQEDFNRDSQVNTERTDDLRLFFLTQGDFPEWITSQFYANAIEPMQKLAYHFILEMEKHKRVSDPLRYKMINLTHFGVYVTDKGFEKQLIKDKLTGVELRVNFSLTKDTSCGSCC